MPKDKIDHRTYLLLGSNQGDKHANLRKARCLLAERAGTIGRESSLYKTQPWQMETDEWFLNQVVELLTPLPAGELLRTILDIESELGRDRSESPQPEGYASRKIDIDILYYNDLILETKQLILPHPRIEARRFTLIPLCEIASDYVHPVLRKTQKELLASCTDNSMVIRLE